MHYATSWKVTSSDPDGALDFPSSLITVLDLNQALTEMSTRNIPRG
jgi:hypothetical protein